MTEEFERFFDQTRSAFAQERTFERARTLAMSALVGLGRRTVTGLLCASAQQFHDWSAAYRLFEQQRFNREARAGAPGGSGASAAAPASGGDDG